MEGLEARGDARDAFRARNWHLAGGRHLALGPRAVIMGVLNTTPDSFSDGGDFLDTDTAVARALEMVDEGAQIIDVGGESTRPGAAAVDGETERARILPVIGALAETGRCAISVDTYRAETARAALEAGAHIVNDIWGCQREPDIAQIAAQYGAGLVMMNNRRGRALNGDVVSDACAFLARSLEIAAAAGVESQAIALDPGFGFAEGTDGDVPLLAGVSDLVALGFPVLIGTSRKRFLGEITGRDAKNRDVATAATSVVARQQGAALFRVHDVATNRDALSVADALYDNARSHTTAA
ncbi:MAG: dihydropteroate synthase [Pseudomonadota bacterium]